MTKELKMVVGVALLATLAVAGALGIFTFSAAQPVGAQETPTAIRSFDPMAVAPGGTVTVTIALENLEVCKAILGLGKCQGDDPYGGFSFTDSSVTVESDGNAEQIVSAFGSSDRPRPSRMTSLRR